LLILVFGVFPKTPVPPTVLVSIRVVGFCAIRPPVKRLAGGETLTLGFTTVRGAGRPVAREVDLVAVTAGALNVVGVRVCLFGVDIVETLGAGLPPVACLVVTELERPELERAELLEELELAEPPPRDPPPPPEELPPLEPPRDPPPLELPRLELPPLEREPPPPPAPADPVPERRAIKLTTSFFFVFEILMF